MAGAGLAAAPSQSIIAVAGPVMGGAIRLTNLGWTTSEDSMRAAGYGAVRLINDYEALALGAAHFRPADLRHAGGPTDGEPGRTLAVLGPGTGFGASALARTADGEMVLATEGGHIGFAPYDALELEVLKVLAAKFGRVSVERIVSGPGLANLHAALCEVHGEPVATVGPAAITQGARTGDAACARSVEQFCAILGGVAGDLALALGARGGVFIGGGIAPGIADLLLASRFRERFEAKGRLSAYVEAVPTWIITHPQAALISAATRLNTAGGIR
jgi:glucokinase